MKYLVSILSVFVLALVIGLFSSNTAIAQCNDGDMGHGSGGKVIKNQDGTHSAELRFRSDQPSKSQIADKVRLQDKLGADKGGGTVTGKVMDGPGDVVIIVGEIRHNLRRDAALELARLNRANRTCPGGIEM